MATRGRKPIPSHLKVITGRDRADRRNEREAQLEIARPSPPAHLCDDAKVEWGRVIDSLYESGLMSDLDRASLAAYCQAYGRWAQAERALSKMAERDPATNGMVIKTTNGNAIQSPLVGLANKAMADMVRYAAEFGMTPSARSRVRAEGERGKKDPAEAYFG